MKNSFSRYSTVFSDAISYCFPRLEDEEELFPKITEFPSVFRVDPSPLAKKKSCRDRQIWQLPSCSGSGQRATQRNLKTTNHHQNLLLKDAAEE